MYSSVNVAVEAGLRFDFLRETSKTNSIVELLLSARRKKGLAFQPDLFRQDSEESELRKILFSINVLMQNYKLYQRFRKTIDGKDRDLSVPCEVFSDFCAQYLVPLIKTQPASNECHGAERGWTPKKSLETHLPCTCALSLDMKSAFPSMPWKYVFDFYYNLSGDRESAKFLADISTVAYEKERGLPQGASFANPLFNRVLRGMDETISQRAGERGLKYSRWIDDVNITSPDRRGIEEFLGAIELVSRVMPVSPSKIYFQDSGEIYLLGHKIASGHVLKNSSEEREKNKAKPLDWDRIRNKNYKRWD